ncbi:MAG: mandelate racemase/muconate lactonizing enzyme family protein [Pseudomonadota bacterium]
MQITDVVSHILQYELPRELGYSQSYYRFRTAHLIEVKTDTGLVGWGECFGPGPVAHANRAIIHHVLAQRLIGKDPLQREVIWHDCYNAMRDHGQKGMPLQALSGIDIALWDLAGKAYNVPLCQLLGGPFRNSLPVYGYGMMLERRDDLKDAFKAEASALEAAGFHALKMKVGLGVEADIGLVRAVREAVKPTTKLMVDANHAYHTADAFKVGRALEDLDVHWFEEPVAPEDRDGYRALRQGLKVNISGGEAEFTRWGWRDLLAGQCLDIAQPEVCALGGISEYLKVLALCHTHFTPVVNHVWGSAVSVAVNLHLLAAMPPLPGGLHPDEPMLEFDTTHNTFRDDLPIQRLAIQAQVSKTGRASLPKGAGHGVVPDPDLLAFYAVP